MPDASEPESRLRLDPDARAVEARRLRDEEGLTQREIARRLGVSPATISGDLRRLDESTVSARAPRGSRESRSFGTAPHPTPPAGRPSPPVTVPSLVRRWIGELLGIARRLRP